MNSNEIKAIAVKVKEKLKGKTDFVSVEKLLDIMGYKVFFSNTPEGEKLLSDLNIGKGVSRKTAFTWKRACVGYVFILDNRLSEESKKLLLYHELGHIVLGHLDRGNDFISDIMRELEADTFACFFNEI